MVAVTLGLTGTYSSAQFARPKLAVLAARKVSTHLPLRDGCCGLRYLIWRHVVVIRSNAESLLSLLDEMGWLKLCRRVTRTTISDFFGPRMRPMQGYTSYSMENLWHPSSRVCMLQLSSSGPPFASFHAGAPWLNPRLASESALATAFGGNVRSWMRIAPPSLLILFFLLDAFVEITPLVTHHPLIPFYYVCLQADIYVLHCCRYAVLV